MKNSLLLKIAGGINLFFLLFHLTFYWLFNWSESLSSLTPDNRNILLTFNVIGNILLLYFTYILLFQSKLILDNIIGKLFLALVSIFYGVRIFAEFYFWSFSGFMSLIIITLCAIPAVCCCVPLLKNNNYNG